MTLNKTQFFLQMFGDVFYAFQYECPAEFRGTEFRRIFIDFLSGIPPELIYGIPYFTEL